ncbi:Hsp20 family protein [Streptomyces sp. NPDC004728]|uniref:Hsp20/alpha crystallin family protein n=1 Tax=Streptomyces sp. NPDC004728 TaxID=3154289 RepID=UPI0033B23C5D
MRKAAITLARRPSPDTSWSTWLRTGSRPDSIDLHVEQNVLTVKAELRTGASSDVLIAEGPTGSFSQRLFLGETLDTDRIAACYDEGVLRLTMVAERAKPRKIEIRAGNGSPEEINV